MTHTFLLTIISSRCQQWLSDTLYDNDWWWWWLCQHECGDDGGSKQLQRQRQRQQQQAPSASTHHHPQHASRGSIKTADVMCYWWSVIYALQMVTHPSTASAVNDSSNAWLMMIPIHTIQLTPALADNNINMKKPMITTVEISSSSNKNHVWPITHEHGWHPSSNCSNHIYNSSWFPMNLMYFMKSW